ncbi:hypothetical protein I5M86_00155 [Serratia marcescens]|nr:hypothetical protein [Serratia marcescens]MBH3063795.1 hypothetical protein [Serratia marcescens]
MAILLGGCAHSPNQEVSPSRQTVPPTLLGQLQSYVVGLRALSRQGDEQATAQLQAMLDGRGISLAALETLREKTAEQHGRAAIGKK